MISLFNKPALKPALKFWMALPAVALVAIAASLALVGVHAQIRDDATVAEATTSPYAEVQYSTLTGTTNTINVTLLPVVLPSGAIKYVNVTVPLTESVSSTGVVTVEAGTPTTVVAPTTTIGSFKAGPYVGPGGGTGQLITLSSPGGTSGGATEWSVSATGGSTGCTWPETATFYVGPIANSPWYSRLKTAGIVGSPAASAYYFGVMDQPSYCGNSQWWGNDNIVGFSQAGSTLNIVSFTFNNGSLNDPLRGCGCLRASLSRQIRAHKATAYSARFEEGQARVRRREEGDSRRIRGSGHAGGASPPRPVRPQHLLGQSLTPEQSHVADEG